MGYIAKYDAAGKLERLFTSHEGIDHDTLDQFGFDWEQVGNPKIQPRYPLKIYTPHTTEDLVDALREIKALGQKVTIRSRGHSSNDLVLAERGVILTTTRMSRILDLDEKNLQATVQAGAVSADIDEYLLARGYGLPVIGDHNDITVGGFASVGGIGPASHRYGMFVDNVVSFEYVTYEGERITCSRTQNRDHFFKVLVGCGRFGVIASMTVKIIRADKYHTVLRNQRSLFTDFDKFVRESERHLLDPSGIFMMRAAFNNLGSIKLGQFSGYKETSQSWWKTLRDKLSYGYLHALGRAAGTLPAFLDKIVKGLGALGVFFPPPYACIKNVEFFSDRIVDVTVGDPTRWLIMLVPAEKYGVLCKAVYEAALDFRSRLGCFTFVSVYIKGIRSEYLSPDNPGQYFCELNLYLGISERGIRDEELADLVSRVDDLCILHGSYRYMHSKTVKDQERRSKIDPNFIYSKPNSAAAD